jgi:membrane-associated HD superfamily phosphohydrolase
MSEFSREAKENKIEMHKGQLEVYERHAEDLAERKEHANRMFEFMKSKVQDDSDKANIDTAQQDFQQRFQDTFREQVEAPTEEIKKELYKDIDEIDADRQSVQSAAEGGDGQGIADDAASVMKNKLKEGMDKDNAMTRKARDSIAVNNQNVHDNYLRILNRYK